MTEEKKLRARLRIEKAQARAEKLKSDIQQAREELDVENED